LAVLMYSAWLIVHRRNLQARRQAYSAHESLALAVRANKDEKLCSMSHPTSPTLRPCRVLADFVAEVGEGLGEAGRRGCRTSLVAARSRGSGGLDASALTHATLTQRTPWAVAAVWQRTWRAGAGSGRWLRA
jgi:hypothetical protein